MKDKEIINIERAKKGCKCEYCVKERRIENHEIERKKWADEKKEIERRNKYADRFECPKCGVIPYNDVTTKKTCIRCYSNLIRHNSIEKAIIEDYKKDAEDELGKRFDDSISCFQSNLIKKIEKNKKIFLKEGQFGSDDICLIEDFVRNLIGSIRK